MIQDARAFHTIMLERKAKVERRIAELETVEGLEEALTQKRTELQTVIMQIDQVRGRRFPQHATALNVLL